MWQEDVLFTKDDLTEFGAAIREHRAVIENTLELVIRHNSEVDQLKQVLAQIGLSTVRTSRKRTDDGKQIWQHGIDKPALSELRRVVELRRTTDEWEQYYAING